ncbi:MAG: NAD-dependent epimerase/dehydratase family protein [Acidimicrobiia bacterium]
MTDQADQDAGLRVAVTGATGNIGTALLRALASEPAVDRVVGIARRTPSLDLPKASWHAADVTRDDLAAPFAGADVVVHLAWAFQPTHHPLETWRVNVEGSARVLEAAVAAGVGAVVHSSSVGAYSRGPKDRGVDESWPTDGLPTAAYGREKAYVERLLDRFEGEHPAIRVVRMRPAFAFQSSAASEQWRIFAGRLIPPRVGGHLPVVPDVARLRFQVVHADDLADAFRAAVVRPVRGPFNVAADPPVGPREIAGAFGARVLPVPRAVVRSVVAAAWWLRLVPTSPQLFDLALSIPVMDTARARDELGWEPRHSPSDALHALVDGLRHGAGGDTPPLDDAAPHSSSEQPARGTPGR